MARALRQFGRFTDWFSQFVATLLLGLLVLVVLYNVLLRYVFGEPPSWTDRVGTSANIAMVLIGLSLAVRHNDLIAMQALYDHLSKKSVLLLEALWNAAILGFSLVFVWFGYIAAVNIPGMYWDYQDLCIHIDMGSTKPGILLSTVRLFEDLVGLAIRPLCVDGAVPRRVMAMLMPIAGVLLVGASLRVLVGNLRAIAALQRENGSKAGRDRPDTTLDHSGGAETQEANGRIKR